MSEVGRGAEVQEGVCVWVCTCLYTCVHVYREEGRIYKLLKDLALYSDGSRKLLQYFK